MDTGSFLGVKWLGRGVNHPHTCSTEVKERVELYFYSPWAFVACSRVNFTFTKCDTGIQKGGGGGIVLIIAVIIHYKLHRVTQNEQQ
jgi:hypothetical protein